MEGHREIRTRIKELTLFKEKQAYPILIAAYNNLNKEDFAKILKLVSVITFRYTVIAKLHTNLKEDIYNKAAMRISDDPTISLNEVAKIIKPLYPADNDFKNDFAYKSISTKRGKKMVRYILYSLENHINYTDFDFEDNSGTIEHILPENGNQNYLEEFPQSIHESVVYRIGNYTLLEGDKNKACDTLSFEEKKKIYKTSQYRLSNEIESNTWTPSSIDLRQQKLANYASSIWRISQYD